MVFLIATSGKRARHAGADDDARLVQECLRGRTHAFGLLVDRYHGVIFNLALRMVRDMQDAEDVTQTAFLKAYEHLDRYDPAYKFFSWLYRIAVNESLKMLKQRRGFEPLDPNLDADDATPDDTIERADTSARVGEALLALSPEDRALLILKHMQGFSYDEIAFVFDTSAQTVKSRLYTARQRLRGVLVAGGLAAEVTEP